MFTLSFSAVPASASGAGPARTVLVTPTGCASGWTAPAAGRTVFHVDNRTDRPGTIYLFNPFYGVTLGHVSLHPLSRSSLAVRLKPGQYRWSCRLQGLAPRTSAQATVPLTAVSGGAAGPLYLMPITAKQMAGPVGAYRSYVEAQLALEATQVEALLTAVAGGSMTAARGAWLTAHLTWHRIGGAYDAFGNLGLAIDGTAQRLQTGVLSPQFTGFHKVELDLWQSDNLAAAGPDTSTLLTEVRTLSVQFPHESIPATGLPLRSHEILEDALRDELSGDDDYGSGTDMASVEADVDGTRELLTLLAPLLAPRAPHLEAVAAAQLDTLDGALAGAQVDGQWVAVTSVPLAQREMVDSAIDAALGTLELDPELLQVVGSTA
ncbi:MAG: EfeM/EfeO family lipoprotein [Acidimicrobiales bacterium]